MKHTTRTSPACATDKKNPPALQGYLSLSIVIYYTRRAPPPRRRAHRESARYNRGTQLYPYTCKMSVHPPDPGPSRFLVRATARHRIGQPVLLFPNVQKLKPVKNNFIVYFLVYACTSAVVVLAIRAFMHPKCPYTCRTRVRPDLRGVRQCGSGSGNLYYCFQTSKRKNCEKMIL